MLQENLEIHFLAQHSNIKPLIPLGSPSFLYWPKEPPTMSRQPWGKRVEEAAFQFTFHII